MENLAPLGEAFIVTKISTRSAQSQKSRMAAVLVSPWIVHTCASMRYKCAEGGMHVQQNSPLDLD